MNDLIYDDSCIPELKKEFPEIIVEDASDDIHTDRVEITLDDSKKKDYFKFCIVQGMAEISLLIQMAILDKNNEDHKILDEVISELKEAKDEPETNK